MTNQLIETLESKYKEIGLIIQQLRKANITIEDVKEHFGVVTDIIEFEGQKYRKVDRLAREGDVVMFNDDGGVITDIVVGNLYPVNKTIDNQVAYWDGITKSVANFYIYAFARTKENVDVYEPIPSPVFATNEGQDLEVEYAEQVKEEKTPNQLRAEIIEKAKWFVEKYLTHSKHGYGIVADNLTPLTTRTGPIKYKFVVNVEKRTIVAIGSLLHTGSIDDNYKGIAKCMPGDVFNEHIGKAIALGRALELDVSEFENAVQPNVPVVGMIVDRMHFSKGKRLDRISIEEISPYTMYPNPLYPHNEFVINKYDYFGLGNGDKIINDTNAQYGGNA